VGVAGLALMFPEFVGLNTRLLIHAEQIAAEILGAL
jgi:hypothetical protein